jgi:predicted HicB family RNase H-like nuclease
MDLTPHVEAIRGRLLAAAGTDDAGAETAERMSLAIEPALHLQLLDLLSQAALELSDQLPEGHVELRLAGRDAELVYADQTAPTSSSTEPEGSTARLTLRMSEQLKSTVEKVAAQEGISTNAWLVAAVKKSLDKQASRKRRVGNRLSGYAQS